MTHNVFMILMSFITTSFFFILGTWWFLESEPPPKACSYQSMRQSPSTGAFFLSEDRKLQHTTYNFVPTNSQIQTHTDQHSTYGEGGWLDENDDTDGVGASRSAAVKGPCSYRLPFGSPGPSGLRFGPASRRFAPLTDSLDASAAG